MRVSTKMTKPHFYKRGEREDRYKDRLVCGGYTIPCNMCVLCALGSVVVASVAVVIAARIFADNIHFCSSSSSCEAGPCQKAVCRGICMMDPIENCCEVDADCPQGDCFTSVCDSDQTCRRILAQDGLGCDDENPCTSPDTCRMGACVGEPLERPCQKCQGGVFQPDISQNNMDCSDGDVCTEGDTCSNGVCSGRDKPCPSETCKVGVCHSDNGCALQNKPDFDFATDLCRTGMCRNGVEFETFKDCFDGDPCTVDACFNGVCLHPDSGVNCTTMCTEDDDCHAVGSLENYVCWDGTCVDTDSHEMIIRMSHGELDRSSCPVNQARLQMRFFMDGDVDNGIMYVPMEHSIVPIFPPTLSAFDVETSYHQNHAQIRTFFSIHTDCRDLVPDCFPFINGEYEFRVTRYPCTNVYGTHCEMDQPSHTLMVVPFSIFSCPLYDVQTVAVVPQLDLGRAGYDVSATLTDAGGKGTWLTDVMVCVPKLNNMRGCVTNEADNCPYRGCFDTPDQYLSARVTFLSDSQYTAAVTTSSSEYHVRIPGYDTYDGIRCGTEPLNKLSFSLLPFSLMNFEGRTVVVDIKYVSPICGSRRLAESHVRNIGIVVI